MGDNIHTSLVIEVENQEDPENKKASNPDKKQDYILDEVYYGEDVTVYALLEVPENQGKKSKPPAPKMKHEKMRDGYKSHHKNSLKYIPEYSPMPKSIDPPFMYLPEEIHESEQLYCLKHVNGDHEMLTGDNLDLKVLYSKSSVSKHMKSSKFRAVSKGVNTDIVQTPKLFQKIQKIVKLNLPKAKEYKGTSENGSAYNVVEMEMQPSIMSFDSPRKAKKSKNSQELYLIPLLMLDDQMLCHRKIEEKTEETEKSPNEPPVEISTQTSSSSIHVVAEINDIQDIRAQLDNTEKKNFKNAILNEISELQSKLTSIKSIIEQEDFIDTPKKDEISPSPSLNSDLVNLTKEVEYITRKTEEIPLEPPLTQAVQVEFEPPVTQAVQVEFEPPITQAVQVEFEPPIAQAVQVEFEPPIAQAVQVEFEPPKRDVKCAEQQTDTPEYQGDVQEEVTSIPTKSISIDYLPTSPVLILTDVNTSKEDHIDTSEQENRKIVRLSKSAINNTTVFSNSLRKSFSFDFKGEKFEFYCLKKIKNYFFKIDSKPSAWLRKKGEGNLDCKIAGEPFVIPKHSKLDFFKFSQELDSLKFNRTNSESNMIIQKGDAKPVLSKHNLVSQITGNIPEVEVHFCNTDSKFSDNTVESEKSVSYIPLKLKPTCYAVLESQKSTSDSEKPPAANRSPRKAIPMLKKDVKPIKKLSNQPIKSKLLEKPSRPEGTQEPLKNKLLSGSRKFTLRGTGESKLHVDKLVKQYSSNSKLSEKTLPRNRLGSHKQDTPELLNSDESKSKPHNTEPYKNDSKKTTEPKVKEEAEKPSKSNSEKSTALSKSKALVELFPRTSETDTVSSTKLTETLEPNEESSVAETEKEGSQNKMDKVGVKSVWALTKVLLFDDGSRKIEILETSLTPPDRLKKSKISHNS